jgi:hypothetical protein|nr:MAG TPA: hypothetical protein [Caudoviricetes sp.]
MVEEHIDPSMTVQTEFEEWVEIGCQKAEDLITNSDKENE